MVKDSRSFLHNSKLLIKMLKFYFSQSREEHGHSKTDSLESYMYILPSFILSIYMYVFLNSTHFSSLPFVTPVTFTRLWLGHSPFFICTHQRTTTPTVFLSPTAGRCRTWLRTSGSCSWPSPTSRSWCGWTPSSESRKQGRVRRPYCCDRMGGRGGREGG